MGGFAYSLNVALTLVGSFVAVYAFGELHEPSEDTENPLDSGTLYQVVGALSTVAVFSAASGMLSMKPKYRVTFFSHETGYRYTQSAFVDNEGDDFIRSVTYACQLRHWKSIVPQVQTWTRESWATWEETKPEWWTEALKRSIPAEFLPLNVAKGAQRPSTLGDVTRASMKKFARRVSMKKEEASVQVWAEEL